MTKQHSLEHQILIAMPTLTNSWFDKTVVYVVEDNEYGSMGLTLNLPHSFTIENLLEHFTLNADQTLPYLDQKVLLGGPVEVEHGFILHEDTGQSWQKSLPLQNGLVMSVSEDLLKAIAEGTGPQKFIACLGFAGWEKGQLADEIQGNSWLTIPYNESLLFEVPTHDKWRVALGTLGIAPEFLSMEAGHD
ncbi:YqgE/AlgH family protein [Thiosulfativibrio zosterae]|uniref:UPF0301 protein THMIRHAT_04940 n=1 Tax=Thiosulfativibrio zosterae TaxID=2675053 RepID=A0A6F8PKZ7_9GAMM|nr:YqgE/AlgH family protein [Thiosulfativibrio zosterae]BBP42748.1 UPF0301 protein [Thiosulfativibrio zosterae]